MASPMFLTYFPKIILFGDSLIQFSFGPGGFGSVLADHFQRKCDVLNRGFSGYTTRSNKLILPKLLKNDNTPLGCILAAVILLGTNDSEKKSAELRHVPIEEYKQNLKNICQQFVDVGVPFQHQILITPPAMNEEKWAVFCEESGFEINLRNEGIKPHAEACLETAKELDVEVFDLWSEMQKTTNWQEKMLNDGVHLTENGNSFVANALIPMLDEKLGSNLTIVFPDWKEIDVKEPEKSLGI